MEKKSALIILFVSNLFLLLLSVSATEAPYSIMYAIVTEPDVSTQEFIDDLIEVNPLYIFNNPYYEKTQLSAARIEEIHALLPETKVILHIFCCSMFNQEKLDSPIAKISFSSQNTQAQFDNAWNNHQDAFMKNISGGYIYNIIWPASGQMWLKENQCYLMDPDNAYFQNMLFNRFKYLVTTGGYDGVYLDLMMPGFLRNHYSSIPYVDNRLLSVDAGRDRMIRLVQSLIEKKNNDPDPKVRQALLFTNSVGGNEGEFYTNDYLINYNRDLKTQGVQIENPFQDFDTMSVEKWRETVDLISGITSLRSNTLKGWLQYHITEGMTDQQRCDQQSLFVYASYLLGRQSDDFAFNFLCKFQRQRIYKSNTLARISLGLPSGQYQSLANGLFIREYERGFVLANPSDTLRNWKTTIELYNAYDTKVYPADKTMAILPRTGLVLLKDQPISQYDLNSDGRINLEDLKEIVKDFGKTANLLNPKTDVNEDGVVNLNDIIVVVKGI